MHTIESTIFSNLVTNQEYFARVFPYVKTEYFREQSDQTIFKLIQKYAHEYKKPPSKEAIKITLDKLNNITETEYQECCEKIKQLAPVPEDLGWLVNETEAYCQQQAVNNALAEGLRIKENYDRPLEERDNRIPDIGVIPDLMKDALSVCFDTSIGHSYFDDWEARWAKYIEKTDKIPCGIRMLNIIMNGGVERKTLNVILAGTNVGKSLALCHLAADYLTQGYNVLYISMEMSEDVVAKRIDANLLDVSMDDFDTLTKNSFASKVKKKRESISKGEIVIKQYPTAGAHVGHFNSLLSELKLKKNFVPDIVIVDYLSICASSRIRGGSDNSYHLVKTIAEELRGFAVENNVVLWSAAQTTRGAWGASDINMEDTAESAGLPATVDLLLGVIETEETVEMGQQMVKQLKSRYGDKTINSRFMIKVSKGKQRWSDVDENKEFESPSQSQPSRPKLQAQQLNEESKQLKW